MRRICLALLLLAPLACEGKGRGGDAQEKATAEASLSDAVEFSGKTTTGEDVSLADYRGKVVLVNIWASWCGPCKQELPELRELHDAYGEDFSVLGISIDKPRNHKNVLALMGQFRIDYPVVLDPDGVSVNTFGVQGYPTTLLVDRNGIIRWRREGAIRPNDTEAATAIKAALEG